MRTGISRSHSSSIVLLVTALACVAGCGQPQAPVTPTITATAAGASLPLVVAPATPSSAPYPYASGTRPATFVPPAPGATRAPMVYPPTTPYPTPTRFPTPTVTPTWTPRPTPTPEPTCTPVRRGEGNGQTPALTVEMLRNGEYHDLGTTNRDIKLDDGKFEDRSRPQMVEQVIFVSAAFGDLQGDGIEDAVVELRFWGGGTGRFPELVAILNEQGKPVQVATAWLGDRQRVVSLTIQDGIVTAEMLTQGQGDGMCCPSEPVTRRFRLECHKLVELR